MKIRFVMSTPIKLNSSVTNKAYSLTIKKKIKNLAKEYVLEKIFCSLSFILKFDFQCVRNYSKPKVSHYNTIRIN